MCSGTPAENKKPVPLEVAIMLLEAALEDGGVRSGSRQFANDLVVAYRTKRYGGLTEKQVEWVYKLVFGGKGEADPGLDMEAGTKLLELFDKAAKVLKKPKMKFSIPGVGTFSITRAGEFAGEPGALYLTRKTNFSPGYVGRLSRDGKFHPVNVWKNNSSLPLILGFMSDPVVMSAQYGKAQGFCCYCGIPLKDARSLHAGYGPVCAKSWGLPWGETGKVDKTSTEDTHHVEA